MNLWELIESVADETEFTLKGKTGETIFYFDRFSAVEGDEVLDMIRTTLGRNVEDANVLSAVMTLPRIKVLSIQKKMFTVTRFENETTSQPMKLDGMEEAAFNAIGAKAIDIKKVLARSLAVNFLDSFKEIKELESSLSSLQDNPSQL